MSTNIAAVIPVGPGRAENVQACIESLLPSAGSLVHAVFVLDGPSAGYPDVRALERECCVDIVRIPKYQPGHEQPRNVGVYMAQEVCPEATHVAFFDTDLLFEPTAITDLIEAYEQGPDDRVLVCPYDWGAEGVRDWRPRGAGGTEMQDPRWPMFDEHPPSDVLRGDLSAGLACWSGNLLWPIAEFTRVGGFWNGINGNRAEDGELGIRAVAMDVGISFSAKPRGFHLWHESSMEWKLAANERDVPLINQRHPWIEGSDVFLVDRDGKAFDVWSEQAGEMVPTNAWWEYAKERAIPHRIPIPKPIEPVQFVAPAPPERPYPLGWRRWFQPT